MRFTKDHEWVALEGGVATVGVTAYAADQLGDVVFVEVPAAGRKVAKGEAIAVVESVKAASDIYAPVSGEVIAVNEVLSDKPETINEDAYGEGWIFKLKLDDKSELDGLLTADEYAESAENDDH